MKIRTSVSVQTVCTVRDRIAAKLMECVLQSTISHSEVTVTYRYSYPSGTSQPPFTVLQCCRTSPTTSRPICKAVQPAPTKTASQGRSVAHRGWESFTKASTASRMSCAYERPACVRDRGEAKIHGLGEEALLHLRMYLLYGRGRL